MPTVGQVVAVVDAQLGSGLLRCLGPGCGGRLARWGFGVERDLVGPGGVTGRVRPRRALCAGCGVSRVLLPDSMLRRRQYGVEVIWAGLLAAARGRPWNQVAAELGVPYSTVREWLRRFARRADRVHAWLCGLLPRLVDDPVWPAGTASAAGDWRPTGFVDTYIMPLAPFWCQFRVHTRRASDTPVPSESSDDCSTLPRTRTKPALHARRSSMHAGG